MLENFRNCPGCGNLFYRSSRNLCPKCIEKEEKDYDTVRKYVSIHPKASIVQVVEATGVAEETILNFLKDGRLASAGMPSVLRCGACGAAISSGTYCESCRNSLSQQFTTAPKPNVSMDKKTHDNSGYRKMHKDEK